jgi:thiamine biosynthesis lipoprotein
MGLFAKHNLGLAPTLALLTLMLASLQVRADWIGDARPLMGTEVRVYLWTDDEEDGRRAMEAVFDEVQRINRLMSTYIDDSEISIVNREAAAGPVVIGDELFRLIQRSLDISVLTLGAFDITYDSVGQHYDFRLRQRPDANTVESAREYIDYRYVQLDSAADSVLFLKEGVRINLGGIAKGYAVERGIDILRLRGVRHAIVTAGGDSRLLGDRRGRPWMVGIRDPGDEQLVAISVPLVDEAISTSGDYERFFIEDGIRYHHIIQPSSGEPASGVRSATVIGPDAVMTDALSTSVFVMGVSQGLTLIATLPDYESIVIDAKDNVYYSDGLAPPPPQPADSGQNGIRNKIAPY